jgi:arginase
VAVKIVRQPNKIALIGAATSAAALSAGREKAPAAIRAAGIVDRLKAAGYDVADAGDDVLQVYKPDEASPRARNLPGVVASIESLKPHIEQAVKSGALPLILGGDCSIALAVIAGLRRYFRKIGMIYMDRDADLRTPSTTTSGCLDEMVVSHLTGRGAAELVRLWGDPPLVREADLALFGFARLDPAEGEVLRQSPLRRYAASDVQRMGPGVAAEEAVNRIHGGGAEFVLHMDVDVISDFPASDSPASGGLLLDDVRRALDVFARQKHLAAIEVTGYNPVKDPDGSGAKLIVGLLSEVLEGRLAALRAEPGSSSVKPGDESPRPSAEATPAYVTSASSDHSEDQSSGRATEAIAQVEASSDPLERQPVSEDQRDAAAQEHADAVNNPDESGA